MTDNYKQRLKAEAIQTRERLEKLRDFLFQYDEGLIDAHLSSEQRALLLEQRDCMFELVGILEKRCQLEGISL
jgi:hypothetical protein